jgi:hypothetical protein
MNCAGLKKKPDFGRNISNRPRELRSANDSPARGSDGGSSPGVSPDRRREMAEFHHDADDL